MSELLHCPFCGSEAKVDKQILGKWIVWCTNDDCIGHWTYLYEYPVKKLAVEAWNTRAERTCQIRCTSVPAKGVKHSESAYQCSACGALMLDDAVFFDGVDEIDWFHYCPNCGAKVME